jgi:hypothetical protein
MQTLMQASGGGLNLWRVMLKVQVTLMRIVPAVRLVAMVDEVFV